MTKPAKEAAISDEIPSADAITAYDEAHFGVYLRLLDADADGATLDEMAQIILGIDPAKEPDRAQRIVKDHLRRARWMTEHGYRWLLAGC